MIRRRHRSDPVPRPRVARRLGSGPAAIVVEVRESARVRRARLVVRPGGAAEVVVPCGAAERAVDELIEAHRGWLVARVDRERRRLERGPALGLTRAGAVPLAGGWIPVDRRPGPRAVAHLRDGVLVVGGLDQAAARAAVLRWYRREARTLVSATVAREAARLRLVPGPIAVRDQRSRWASCARGGALSFSWRLVLAPPHVLDYVVVHELCHLVQPNHSPAFWQLVDAARAGWQSDAAWLREHGHELHAFTPLTP